MFKFYRMVNAVAIAAMFDKTTSIQEVEELRAKGFNWEEIINTVRARHILAGRRHVMLDETDSKFTPYERAVCEWGFAICKYCGAAEGDWDNHSTCYGFAQAEGELP